MARLMAFLNESLPSLWFLSGQTIAEILIYGQFLNGRIFLYNFLYNRPSPHYSEKK